MPINYQYQPDDPAGSLFSVPDEQSDSWWAGVKQCFVAVAITAAVATSASATQVAISTASQHQDEVGFLHGQPDEDCWQNYVQPVTASIFQRLPLEDREEIPAGSLYGTIEEDLWVNQVQSIAFWAPPPKAFADDDIIVSQPQPVDEDLWINAVTPIPASIGGIYLPDAEEIPAGQLHGQPDEDFWQNPVAPVAASIFQVLPYLFDAGEDVPVVVFSSPDEDYWINPVFPQVPTLRQFMPWDQEELPGSLHGQPDEDYWQNPVVPVSAATYQPLPINWIQDDFGYATISFDEEVWQNQVPLAQISFRPFAPWDSEEIALPTLRPDEDYWQNAVAPVPASLRSFAPWDSEETIVPQPVPLPFDEDFWQNPVPSVVGSIYQSLPIAIGWDDEITQLSPVRTDWFVCLNSSVVPSMVALYGYAGESEPPMSSGTLAPIPLIEWPFRLFPNNGIPIIWAPILGSTVGTTRTPITDASGTLTVLDPNGNPVPGADGIEFVQISTGVYQALIDGAEFDGNDIDGNPLPFGAGYLSVVSLTSPSVQQPGYWPIPTILGQRDTP